jgi:tRNA(fMet)-specific endonuclease VapC
MKYLLDTNTCIRHLNNRSPSITARFRAIDEREIVICSVVKAELYLGAMKSRTPEITMEKQRAFAERFISLPFDDVVVVHYARIRARLEMAGTPIGSNDLMIASIALAYNLILVTHNTREFSRVPDLQIEDWETA